MSGESRDWFLSVLDDVRFRDWRFIVGSDGDGRLGDGSRKFLQVEFDAKDSTLRAVCSYCWAPKAEAVLGESCNNNCGGRVIRVTRPVSKQRGRKWWLSPHMTRSEVVQTALKAVLAAVEHEAREDFRYRGEAIFGPHLSVDALHRLVQAGAAEVRA